MKMLENLKNMSIEELENLKTKINEEIGTRKPKTEYVVYSHDCMNSANYHKGKYKHWAKLVTAIDATKANGYAYQGEFLNINVEHKVPAGSLVVEVCNTTIEAYRITENGKELVDEARTNAMSALIDKLANMIA